MLIKLKLYEYFILDGGILFLRLTTKDMQLEFSNNLFEGNFAFMGICFDVESEGILNFHNNKFIQNIVMPSWVDKIGIGSIGIFSGNNLVGYGNNNLYFRNYGLNYGSLFILFFIDEIFCIFSVFCHLTIHL